MKNLLAQTQSRTINLQPGGIASTIQGFTIGNIISTGLQLVLIVAAIIFFIMLVVGGIRYIASGGDKGATEAARGQITAALIGLVIVFAAWAIASLVGSIFGFSIFNFTVPSITGGSSGGTH